MRETIEKVDGARLFRSVPTRPSLGGIGGPNLMRVSFSGGVQG